MRLPAPLTTLSFPERERALETELQDILAQFQAFYDTLMIQARNLLLPSRLYQIAILVGCFIVATLLRHWVGRRMHEWMRTLEGWPKWRLRLLLILQKRLRMIFFTVLAWSATWSMQAATTFPSRSYLLELVATIALALLLVSLAARFVRNPALRRVVTWGLWIYVTLYYIGLIDETTRLLDGLAISFGSFRLSLLAILKALVVTGLLFTLARIVAGTASGRIRKAEHMSPSMQVLAIKMLQIVLFGAAFFIGLKAVGFDLTGLAVLSGAIGVGLGFGLQKVVSNLVSGVIILLDKSIKPGDVISHRRDLRLDQLADRALRVDHHAGRQGIPDPERGPDHRPGGQLVAFQRIRAARHLFRHRLRRRPACRTQAGDRGCRRGQPGARASRRRFAISSASATVQSITSCGSGSATRLKG